MDNASQFDKLIFLCSNDRLYRFKYHTEDTIGILLGDNRDIVLVCIDDKVMLLSQAVTQWDALDSQSIMDFEVDTMHPANNLLEWITNRWDY